MVALSACGPSEADTQATAAAIQTGAAETVNAQFTLNAQLTPSATHTVQPSNTPEATQTPASSPIASATTGGGATGGNQGATAGGGCDVMGFVSDVTIPDGEDITAGATFTKTWRLKNNGTCTWSTSYNVAFNNGTQMGGPTTQALTASVAPGATVDISISLTAPAANGSYTGAWNLRNAAGENFGYFYVQIDAVSGTTSGTPTASGSGTSVTLNANSLANVNSAGTPASGLIAGDNAGNTGLRGLFSFDLTSIPDNATITSISLSMGTGSTTTDPFAQSPTFAPLSLLSTGATAGGYSGSGTSLASFSSYAELSNAVTNDTLRSAVQTVITSTANVINFRIQFLTETNNDSVTNQLQLFGPTLKITYTTP